MEWLWWIGAGLAALCSVACGVNIGVRVAKGAARVWQRDVMGWVVGFHGLVGVGALMMIVQTRG